MTIILTVPLNEAQAEWASPIILAAYPGTDVTETLSALAGTALVEALSALSMESALVASNEAENARRIAEASAKLAAFPEPEPEPGPERQLDPEGPNE